MGDKMLRLNDAGKFLGISTKEVHELIVKGELGAWMHPISRRMFVKQADCAGLCVAREPENMNRKAEATHPDLRRGSFPGNGNTRRCIHCDSEQARDGSWRWAHKRWEHFCPNRHERGWAFPEYAPFSPAEAHHAAAIGLRSGV